MRHMPLWMLTRRRQRKLKPVRRQMRQAAKGFGDGGLRGLYISSHTLYYICTNIYIYTNYASIIHIYIYICIYISQMLYFVHLLYIHLGMLFFFLGGGWS